MPKRILVLGATGLLGQPTARRLHQDGFKVRVLTRDEQKAQKLFDASFEVLKGDPADPASLQKGMEGCYGVHVSLPTGVERSVVELVVKAASQYGIQRISYISGATVAEKNRWFPMIDQKFLAEKALREGTSPWSIFCPSWVMESLALFVVQGRASVLGKQPHPYHWVAADDLARMVSSSYQLETAANQRYRVLGPQAITMQAALQQYCAALHPEIKSISSMPFWLVNLLATLTRNQGLKTAGDMMAYFEKVGEEGDPVVSDPAVLGAPTTRLEQWLKSQKSK